MVKFSPEDKVQAVKRYLYGNESGGAITQSIGAHHSNLHQWIKQYEAFGEDVFVKNYTNYPAQYKIIRGKALLISYS
ncbi:transposase [Halobacillus naozhouensis]|uniref:Transposase n=1 Tax=Halobacillus naozhouensis TaxID=554880 RepID=A0ABY8J0D9_9BACI|nr:transposase [Halobacillus naozhouensis]WFT75959.1 transposase [Halobacillus naozhouensis]